MGVFKVGTNQNVAHGILRWFAHGRFNPNGKIANLRDGWARLNMEQTCEEFDSEYDQGEYEKKIARLIKNPAKRARNEPANDFEDWWPAIRLLNKQMDGNPTYQDWTAISHRRSGPTEKKLIKWRSICLAQSYLGIRSKQRKMPRINKQVHALFLGAAFPCPVL